MSAEELTAAVDEAMAPTVGRLLAEKMRIENDATVNRLAQQGVAVTRIDVMSLHLAVLLDTLFGDLDDPRRQEFEIRVHTQMAEQLAGLEQQATRAKLMQGTQGFDASQLPRPKRQR